MERTCEIPITDVKIPSDMNVGNMFHGLTALHHSVLSFLTQSAQDYSRKTVRTEAYTVFFFGPELT